VTLRVLHLVGSAVSDFLCDLSRLYAEDCLASTAAPARYEFHVAYVTPDRTWRFPVDLRPASIAAAEALPVADALQAVVELGIDVMVPQMFCLPGMTTYRAAFDLLGIPYVGNTPDVMALAAHKARARAVVAGAGVAVPEGQVWRPGDTLTIPPPAVVKPVDADNSVGVTLVRPGERFDAALDAALGHADAALVESYVGLGREVRCGIVERDGRLVSLPLEEYRVDETTHPIRGTADKIRRDDGGLHLEAKDAARAWIVDPGDPLTSRVWEAAAACHTALGCRHYSLFDFRVDPDGRPWFLEAGLYCSFARTSVVAVMAAATGVAVDELFAATLREALG
jgi:D-alanine-D-alanine ligase